MASVLCIAGLDPSGHAGLSADIRALEFLGIHPLPVASVLTVQNSSSFVEFQPVPVDLIGKQIAAILEDGKPDAAKLGILGTAELATYVADALSEAEIPFVVDPVLSSSTGYSLVDDELLDAYKHDVFPAASIVTPNAPEASTITGIEVKDPESARTACQHIHDLGPKTVLVKGGHFASSRGTDVFYDGKEFHELRAREIDVDIRGTGCTFSSMIAGNVAMGQEMWDAVRYAKRNFSRAMEISGPHGKLMRFNEPRVPEQSDIWHSVNDAMSDIISFMPSSLIAEVGNNLAFALPGAAGPGDICSLDSRLLVKGNRVVTLGTPVFGRKSHVGRVVLAAMAHDPEMRCAMNLRYSDDLIGHLEDIGFEIGSFSREEQPEDSSSMEWGTGKAISELGYVPDAVYDLGGVGKEPMIRLLAHEPGELLVKLRRIADITDLEMEVEQ